MKSIANAFNIIGRCGGGEFMNNNIALKNRIKALVKEVKSGSYSAELVEKVNILERDVSAVLQAEIENFSNYSLPKLAYLEQKFKQRPASLKVRLYHLLDRFLPLRKSTPDWSLRDSEHNQVRLLTRLSVMCERVSFLASTYFASSLAELTSFKPEERDVEPQEKEAGQAGPDISILTTSYPMGERAYGGGFIRDRAMQYAKYGKSVNVIVIKSGVDGPEIMNDAGIQVLSTPRERLTELLRLKGGRRLTLHSPDAAILYAAIKVYAEDKVTVFLHGYETRRYERLIENYDPAAIARQAFRLEPINLIRLSLARRMFSTSGINIIFVSNYLKKMAIEDVRQTPLKSYVVPNSVNLSIFHAEEKRVEQRFSLLAIRSFERANYAGDLIVKTLLCLSKAPEFSQMSCHLQGFGVNYDDLISPLKGFSNITFGDLVLSQKEIVELHKTAGIFLCPSRHDTQGVSICEAMASGLVGVSSIEGGIPEILGDRGALLIGERNPEKLANACLSLMRDPEAFKKRSMAGQEHIRKVCGAGETIERELKIINS